MRKASISFPKSMLEEIDHRAEKTGTTRSGFVRAAVAAQLHRAELDRRAERVSRAIAGMRAIGKRLPPGPPGVEVLRRTRLLG